MKAQVTPAQAIQKAFEMYKNSNMRLPFETRISEPREAPLNSASSNFSIIAEVAFGVAVTLTFVTDLPTHEMHKSAKDVRFVIKTRIGVAGGGGYLPAATALSELLAAACRIANMIEVWCGDQFDIVLPDADEEPVPSMAEGRLGPVDRGALKDLGPEPRPRRKAR